MKNEIPRKFTIVMRDQDAAWWSSLMSLAKEFDRTPGHIARQLIVAGLVQMGAVTTRSDTHAGR